MILKELLQDVDYRIISGSDEIEIDDITYDSRKNTKNTVFIMLSNKEEYLKEAISKGAIAVVVPENAGFSIEESIVYISVKCTRIALARMSRAYFGYPDKKLYTIGITGTKGKTTTAYMIQGILASNGIKTGLIGTIEITYNEEWYPQINTTPESYNIYETFMKMHLAGCQVVVMEVSSQGLKMARCEGINFDVGIFTNISPDHIGELEHKNFEEYLECKKKLFRNCKKGIINCDDENYSKLVQEATCEILTFGIEDKGELTGYDITPVVSSKGEGICFKTKGVKEMTVELGVPGRFNVYNCLAAIGATSEFVLDNMLVVEALEKIRVKGRIETVKTECPFTIIIDYAHNALGLRNLLETMREYSPNRLICCFGCGGNRDKTRRFEMGEVAGRLADISIITSDNPRYENPDSIISDIVSGICKSGGNYVVVPDRKEAVKYAINIGEKGDIIVFAGKGHEDYQEICGVRIPFNERLIIQELVGKG